MIVIRISGLQNFWIPKFWKGLGGGWGVRQQINSRILWSSKFDDTDSSRILKNWIHSQNGGMIVTGINRSKMSPLSLFVQTFQRHQPIYVTPDALLPMTSDSTWRSCARIWRWIRDTFGDLIHIISRLCWGSQILWSRNPAFKVSFCTWIHQTLQEMEFWWPGERAFHSICVMAHNMDGNYQIISVLWEA